MRKANSTMLLYGPIVLWMAVIFAFSSMEGSGQISSMPTLLLLERKGAHIIEYFILTMLLLRAGRHFLANNTVRISWMAFLVAFLYAVSDEIHQLFVFGRTGKALDVMIDSVGIVIAIFVWRCAIYVCEKKLDKPMAGFILRVVLGQGVTCRSERLPDKNSQKKKQRRRRRS